MAMDKPNIVLILVDQFRGDCVRVAGNPYIQTPYLDELAGYGCLFEQAYSPSPTCIPARACLVTGLEPSGAGFFTNDFSVEWTYQNTMMEQLRNGGYQTINVGKNHFKPQRNALGFEINMTYETGKDERNLPSDYHQWLAQMSAGQVQDTAYLHECNGWVPLPWTHPRHLHPTEWTADESIRQLERRDPTRPFYLQMSFQRPHPPLDPPPEMLALYQGQELPGPWIGDWVEPCDKDTLLTNAFEGRIEKGALRRATEAYYASITYIDRQIGKLTAYLMRNRLWNNTVILFTSDHGELLGDHHLFRKGPALQGSAHIPFIVKPVERMKQQRIQNPVSLCDIMPTFLEWAGIEPAYPTDGDSLLPLLRGQCWSRTYIYGENYRDLPFYKAGWAFVVDGRYKYIWDSLRGRELLFDLKNDPHELTNLAGKDEYAHTMLPMRDYLKAQYAKRPADNMLDEYGELAFPRLLPSYRIADAL